EMHAASSLVEEDEVRRWRGHLPERKIPPPHGQLIPLKPLSDGEMSREAIGNVILKRGSTRRFARDEAISFEQFSTLLYRSMKEIPADFLAPPAQPLKKFYLTAPAMDGLQSGAYVLDPDEWAIELIKAGAFRKEAGSRGLEQALPAEAA